MLVRLVKDADMSDVTEEPEAQDVGIDAVLASDETRPAPGLIGEETDGRRPSAFDAQLANSLAARTRPTVLVLAGGVACGKTSVYAAIYERLGRGEFAGRMFAGSYTIPGFEERCHYWREGSDRTTSWSKHTQGGDLPWLTPAPPRRGARARSSRTAAWRLRRRILRRPDQ